jgi:hypothetical protein
MIIKNTLFILVILLTISCKVQQSSSSNLYLKKTRLSHVYRYYEVDKRARYGNDTSINLGLALMKDFNKIFFPLFYEKNLNNQTLLDCKVILNFIVDKKGNVCNLSFKNKCNLPIEGIIVKTITKMNKWNPAVKNGKNVAQFEVVPFTLKIGIE